MVTHDNSSAWGFWTNTTTDTGTSYEDTYSCWVDSSTSTASTTVWAHWVIEDKSYVSIQDYGSPIEESKEVLLERQREERRQRRKERIRHREEAKADKKALELLKDTLGEEQMEVFNRTKRVLVKGKKNDWLIRMHEYGNVSVKKVEKDKIVDLCVHFKDSFLPMADKVSGFALLAKYNEEKLEQEANRMGSEPIEELPECAVM